MPSRRSLVFAAFVIRICRGRDGSTALRRAAAAFLITGKNFRKIQGYRRAAILAGLVLLATFGAIPAFASTYTVTSLTDSGTGSLRAAIALATSGNDTINFSSSVSTGTINLPATLRLTQA